MAFLDGRYREIETTIEDRMKDAAAEQDYERAARERDRLQAVRSLLERQRVMGPSIGTLDAIAVTVEGTTPTPRSSRCATARSSTASLST